MVIFVRTRHVSLARFGTLALAVLCLTTQVSAFAHLALVPHATCIEHGEPVDAGAQFPVKLAQSADESAVVADPLTTVAAHSHDHCILSALRRSPAHLQTESAPNAVLTALNLGERRDADQLIPPVIALLDLAPKSSPPAS